MPSNYRKEVELGWKRAGLARYGIDAEDMEALMFLESGGNANAKAPGSTAKGLMQFLDGSHNALFNNKGYGAKYGLVNDPYNPETSTTLGALYARDNIEKHLLAKIPELKGKQIHPCVMYIMHMMGEGGGSSFLRELRENPDQPASAVVGAAAIKANPGVFGKNGERSLREVWGSFVDRFNKGYSAFGYDKQLSKDLPFENYKDVDASKISADTPDNSNVFNDRVIRSGDGSRRDPDERTKVVQRMLRDLGPEYQAGKFGPARDGIDGVFGSMTKKMVIKFQEKNGISPANGEVDEATFNKLQAASNEKNQAKGKGVYTTSFADLLNDNYSEERSERTRRDITASYRDADYVPGSASVRYGSPFKEGMSAYNFASSSYGDRTHPITGEHKHHNGIDISRRNGPIDGEPILSVANGQILRIGYEYGSKAEKKGGAGNFIEIMHPDGTVSRYMHLKEPPADENGKPLEEGQIVAGGMQIGKVGNTGGSTAPHLHLEFRRDGKPVDPEDIIPGLRTISALHYNKETYIQDVSQQFLGNTGNKSLVDLFTTLILQMPPEFRPEHMREKAGPDPVIYDDGPSFVSMLHGLARDFPRYPTTGGDFTSPTTAPRAPPTQPGVAIQNSSAERPSGRATMVIVPTSSKIINGVEQVTGNIVVTMPDGEVRSFEFKSGGVPGSKGPLPGLIPGSGDYREDPSDATTIRYRLGPLESRAIDPNKPQNAAMQYQDGKDSAGRTGFFIPLQSDNLIDRDLLGIHPDAPSKNSGVWGDGTIGCAGVKQRDAIALANTMYELERAGQLPAYVDVLRAGSSPSRNMSASVTPPYGLPTRNGRAASPSV